MTPLYTTYSDAYSKTSGSLWQYYTDELALDDNGNIIDFLANKNNSVSFKFKLQITGKTGNGGTKNTEIMVIVAGTAENLIAEFKVTDAKLYVPVVTVSTQDNVKLLKQLESGFKRTINSNKYLCKTNKSSAKQIFRCFNWYKFSRSKGTFCFAI